MIRRLAAVLAALALTLLAAGAVAADTASIKSSQTGSWTNAPASCDSFTTAQPGQVVWHFSARTTTADFTLTATFSDGTTVSGRPVDRVTGTSQRHWYVTTAASDSSGDAVELQAASISGTGTITPNSFNLSNVCANPDTPIPEAPASGLLVLSAALVALAFVRWRMRQSTAA